MPNQMPNQESEQQFNPNARPEQREVKEGNQVETGAETEANAITGAEMLETPSDGSFVHGLQVFVAWVKHLLAGD